MVCGAGKTGPVGFRYWRNGYAWGDGILVNNNGKYVAAFVSGLINSIFTFQGTELVAVTAGEASPRALRSAIRKVMFRILVFYVLCMLFMGLLVPYNDQNLLKMVVSQETHHSLLLWKIPVRKFYHIFSMPSLSQPLSQLVTQTSILDHVFFTV